MPRTKSFSCQPRLIVLAVVCCACSKPRVIYSKLQLSDGSIRLLQGISEDCFYVCGAQLPLTLTSDEQLPVVHEGINCNSPVEFAYTCAYCGSDDCTIGQALKEQFQTVLPICRECCASGSKPITRGMFRKCPNKVAEPNNHVSKINVAFFCLICVLNQHAFNFAFIFCVPSFAALLCPFFATLLCHFCSSFVSLVVLNIHA